MNIQVGDKITGKWLDNSQEITEIMTRSEMLDLINENIKEGKIQILKIERPQYTTEYKKRVTNKTNKMKKYLNCLLFTYKEIKDIQKDKYHYLHDFICRWFGTEEDNEDNNVLYFSEDCVEVEEDDYWLVNIKKDYAMVIHNLKDLDKKVNMINKESGLEE